MLEFSFLLKQEAHASYPCKEGQMFFDSHCFEQYVLLRTEANVFTNPRHVSPYIKSINVSGTAAWLQET